ncbi:flippase-like domain-containing protein [Candidatus Pacearchaeota archaeon]|nr:flippase-like domain-containing protein [Candidatus Pacearchaeota archaeon]
MRFKPSYLGIIGIGILAYLIYKAGVNNLLKAIKDINLIWMIPVLVFSVITILINAMRWRYITNTMGISLSTKDAFSMTFKAMFAENSPGKMGEIFVRANYLQKKTGIGFGKALFSTTFSRFVDLWVTAMEAVIALLIVIFLFGIKVSVVIPSLIFLIAIILFFIILKNEKTVKSILKPIYNFVLPKSKQEKASQTFEEFYAGVKSIGARVIIVSFIYDLIALATAAFGLYFTALALGINFPLYLAILAEPLMTVAVSLPISFSGLGAREGVFAYLFSLVNMPLEKAIVFSLTVFILRNILSLFGVIMIFFDKEKSKKTDQKSVPV